MRNPLETTIQNHLLNPETPYATDKRCGMVLRYSGALWKTDSMHSFRTSYTCNALLITVVEGLPHMEITKNPRGIEVSFRSCLDGLESAFAIQKTLEEKRIQAGIVLYFSDGIVDKNNGWHSAEHYLAEKIAIYARPYEIRLKRSFHEHFSPPEGVGIFPLKNTETVHHNDDLVVAKNYRC